MKPSIKTVCKKNQLQDGLFPIYLRVTINRQSKFYTTPYKCKLTEWNDKTGEFSTRFRNHLSFNSSLRSLKDEATDILEKITKEYGLVILVKFDSYYRNEETKQSLFGDFFEGEIKILKDNGQISYKTSMDETLKALLRFKTDIYKYRFEDIDFKFLTNFENFLRKHGANDGGIAAYMRNIRTIYNRAINYKIVSQSFYPFTQFKISKYKKKKTKKALSKEELDKIINFDITKLNCTLHARYIYLFSYLARGMNFTDLAELKWSDLDDKKFNYVRKKTKINIKVKLPDNQLMDEILAFYNMYRIFDTDYIFPILKKDKCEYSEEELLQLLFYSLQIYNKLLSNQYLLSLHKAHNVNPEYSPMLFSNNSEQLPFP